MEEPMYPAPPTSKIRMTQVPLPSRKVVQDGMHQNE
jgi:hypothetical protein